METKLSKEAITNTSATPTKNIKPLDTKVEEVKKDSIVKTVAQKEEPKTSKVESKKTPVKKTSAKKPSIKKTEIKTEIFVQYMGKEVSEKDMIAKATKLWSKETGKKKAEFKSIALYVKPEESAVYYVVNGTDAGKIEF